MATSTMKDRPRTLHHYGGSRWEHERIAPEHFESHIKPIFEISKGSGKDQEKTERHILHKDNIILCFVVDNSVVQGELA